MTWVLESTEPFTAVVIKRREKGSEKCDFVSFKGQGRKEAMNQER